MFKKNVFSHDDCHVSFVSALKCKKFTVLSAEYFSHKIAYLHNVLERTLEFRSIKTRSKSCMFTSTRTKSTSAATWHVDKKSLYWQSSVITKVCNGKVHFTCLDNVKSVCWSYCICKWMAGCCAWPGSWSPGFSKIHNWSKTCQQAQVIKKKYRFFRIEISARARDVSTSRRRR